MFTLWTLESFSHMNRLLMEIEVRFLTCLNTMQNEQATDPTEGGCLIGTLKTTQREKDCKGVKIQ